MEKQDEKIVDGQETYNTTEQTIEHVTQPEAVEQSSIEESTQSEVVEQEVIATTSENETTSIKQKKTKKSKTKKVNKTKESENTDEVKLIEKVNAQRNAKTRFSNGVYITLNAIIFLGLLWFISQKHTIDKISIVSSLNVWWVFLAVVAIIVLPTIATQILIYRATKTMMFTSYQSQAVYRCYNGLTYLGGRPFQTEYLLKHGMNYNVANSITKTQSFMSVATFVFIAIITLLLNFSLFINTMPIVVILATISIVILTAYVAVVFFLLVSKKSAPKFVLTITNTLQRMHLIKDSKECFTKIMKWTLSLQKSVQFYAQRPLNIISQFVLFSAKWILKLSLPYLIYIMIATNPVIDYATLLAVTVMSYLVEWIIPFPEGASLKEVSFVLLTQNLMSGTILFYLVIIWKLATYGVTLLQGGLVLLYNKYVIAKRPTYQEKRERLQQKSK